VFSSRSAVVAPLFEAMASPAVEISILLLRRIRLNYLYSEPANNQDFYFGVLTIFWCRWSEFILQTEPGGLPTFQRLATLIRN